MTFDRTMCMPEHQHTQSVNAVCWNVAAINNNPFEYWVSSHDVSYDVLMRGVEQFIEDPNNDIRIQEIFSDCRFDELTTEIKKFDSNGAFEIQQLWKDDFRNRRVFQNFLKDKTIGNKRLVSMPDRITNTITTDDGCKIYRPTVINAYRGRDLHSIDSWWQCWKKFMFHTSVKVKSCSCDTVKPVIVSALIPSLSRAKYPAISTEEEKISIALQILCLALLDVILIYIMNSVGGCSWESVRAKLCDALILNKENRLCAILAHSYLDSDVIFLQEASALLMRKLQQNPKLSQNFLLLEPPDFDPRRNQNSLILLRRGRFKEATCLDVTREVLAAAEGRWFAAGDLVAATAECTAGHRWLLASFHGDSAGLLTQPLLAALDTAARGRFANHRLLVGLDANPSPPATISASAVPPMALPPSAQLPPPMALGDFLDSRRMVSVWGRTAAAGLATTCSARTPLQAQQAKATPHHERASPAHRRLKDWILAYGDQLAADPAAPMRDNTGRRRFAPDLVFPSTDFPSDHAVVSATLRFRACGLPPPSPPPPQPVPAPPDGLCGFLRCTSAP